MGKRILKKEKGSITIFVLSTMLVVLGVIFVAYFSMMNKLSSQEDEIRKIYEEYNVSDDEMKQIYDETLEELNTLPKADGNQENNIVVNDSLGNKIEVPKGFKVVNTNDNVEEGIIIEDVSAKDDITKGSQFVWIPVGTIKTSKGDVTINLDRYTFAETTGNETSMGEKEIKKNNGDIYEEISSNIYKNITARNIEIFKKKVTDGEAKGFYLGRYEARDGVAESTRNNSTNDNNQVVTKADKFVYNYVTQNQAATLSRNMYGETEDFTSDLVNSYAWDTILVFIQKCSGDTRYSQQASLNTGSIASKGTTNDVKCNIYDIASNCWEWSTETSKNQEYCCTLRGGGVNDKSFLAGSRYAGTIALSDLYSSFRPIIYL